MDRNDVITFFPIVWGMLEPYAKKLLYIINPEKLEKIHADREGSLARIFRELGIKYFENDRSKRTRETNAIHIAYSIRNIESHECISWSLTKCYDNMSNVLCAYLLITNKVLPAIQRKIEGTPTGIIIPPLKTYSVLLVDIFDYRLYTIFLNLNELSSGYRKIEEYICDHSEKQCTREYDRNGWEISFTYKRGKYEAVNKYNYKTKNNLVVKRIDTESKTYDGKINDTRNEECFDQYFYDDDNRIITVVHIA